MQSYSNRDMSLERELTQIRQLPRTQREEALRKTYTRVHVGYYRDGRPVKWTVRMMEQAVRYQLMAWEHSPDSTYPLLYPLTGWFIVVLASTDEHMLNARQLRRLITMLPKTNIICDACGKKIRFTDEQESTFPCWRDPGYGPNAPIRHNCVTCKESLSCNWHPRGEILCYECQGKSR